MIFSPHILIIGVTLLGWGIKVHWRPITRSTGNGKKKTIKCRNPMGNRDVFNVASYQIPRTAVSSEMDDKV